MVYDPTAPLTGQLRVIENAVLFPFDPTDAMSFPRRAGVFTQDGQYVETSACERVPGQGTLLPMTQMPDLPVEETRTGTWLYGGLLYKHFGHFLMESTGRLWGHKAYQGKIRGELFFFKRTIAEKPQRFIWSMTPLLSMFGARKGGSRSRGVVAPVRVERLVVPPQGLGLGAMAAGSPESRQWIHERFAQAVPAAGAQKIYVSRSGLDATYGRYIGEARLERLLEAEGYRVFHPQRHSLEEQIAQFKAAKLIVSSDASALHLAGFCATEQTRLAIVFRRDRSTIESYVSQFNAFAGVDPVLVNALTGEAFQVGQDRVRAADYFSVLDFPQLGHQLAQAGFIAHPAAWATQPAAEIKAELQDLARATETAIYPVGADQPPVISWPEGV